VDLVRAKVIAIASIAFFCSAGCVGSGDQGVVGGGYSQCDSESSGTSDNSPEVTATINTLVPLGTTVQCTGKQSFQLNSQTVFLVIVPYGKLNDCPAGCFSSEVCSIVDGSDTLLYSADWTIGSERPLSIPPDCPELGGAENGDTTTGCTNQPPGFSHPVTQTTQFQDFRLSEKNNNGNFAFASSKFPSEACPYRSRLL
jgi:hypothetical protein